MECYVIIKNYWGRSVGANMLTRMLNYKARDGTFFKVSHLYEKAKEDDNDIYIHQWICSKIGRKVKKT